MLICAATGNAGKLKELRRILEAQGHQVKSQKELGIDCEPEETGATFVENARIKARAISRLAGLPTVADDSGLEVDALGGAPGVYSARYCGRHGDDEANNDKLLAELAAVPEGGRGARFVSSVCLWLPDGRDLVVTGACPGRVIFERRGTNGFGYDPLFVPDRVGLPDGSTRPNEAGLTYAELADEQKDAISHRGQALALLQKALPEFLAASPALAFERNTKADGDRLIRTRRPEDPT